MIINSKTSKKITQREYPKLSLIKPKLSETQLMISIDEKIFQIDLQSMDQQSIEYNQVSKALSYFIGIKCKLIRNDLKIQSWDKYPLLVVFQESIKALNDKINSKNFQKYDYLRFRPNILFTSNEYLLPFQEESIKYLQLNQTKFICSKNLWIDKCLNVTCIDHKRGKMDDINEPKTTIKQWGDSFFGLGLKILNEVDDDYSDLINVGDKVRAQFY